MRRKIRSIFVRTSQCYIIGLIKLGPNNGSLTPPTLDEERVEREIHIARIFNKLLISGFQLHHFHKGAININSRIICE